MTKKDILCYFSFYNGCIILHKKYTFHQKLEFIPKMLNQQQANNNQPQPSSEFSVEDVERCALVLQKTFNCINNEERLQAEKALFSLTSNSIRLVHLLVTITVIPNASNDYHS